jgi:nucleolar protein 58
MCVDVDSLRLKTFSKFENTADALENISALVEGKVSPKLASLLKELDDKSATLIVSDPKLGKITVS